MTGTSLLPFYSADATTMLARALFSVAKVSNIFMPPNNLASIFEFRSLCYDVLSLSCLNGIDKIINFVLQFRFPVLRNTAQHIYYNIYATFNIVSAISGNVSRQAFNAFGKIHTVNAPPVCTLVTQDSDGFQIIEKTPLEQP